MLAERRHGHSTPQAHPAREPPAGPVSRVYHSTGQGQPKRGDVELGGAASGPWGHEAERQALPLRTAEPRHSRTGKPSCQVGEVGGRAAS